MTQIGCIHPVNSASTRKAAFAVAFMLSAALVLLAFAPSALAVPKGEYAVFSDCPLSNPNLTECLYSKTTGGEVKLGSSEASLRNPTIIQGGTIENEATGELTFVGAADGETLSKTPQPVSGGLANLIPKSSVPAALLPLYEAVFENGLSGVNATTELAAPASSIGINTNNLVSGSGVALSLPVKVHLENPFLGSNCYIGSSSNPIVLNLTTGTTSPPAPNSPITGNSGAAELREEGRLAVIDGVELVDNAFAAPEATGCGPLPLSEVVVDPILNAKVGLPSAAGNNTARLKANVEQAFAGAVRRSEE
jgi:hypothetical protein